MASPDELEQIKKNLLALGKTLDAERIMRSALNQFQELSARHYGNYNVFILNARQLNDTSLSFNDIKFEESWLHREGPFVLEYRLFIFKDGTADHTRCEGGWVNWGMSGRFRRSGHQGGIFSTNPDKT
ncbi:hypothetical protein TOPH_09088 [Tolypocladium ophioglossoides CBS 100239]|uniref:Uncharacterized protein n=1 Tax=Tolypocladium ophioglossoides (strain CBS 100239) TaxID=1163406 RepID=A0A0L0MWP2_TOLOC|nr:hypothetical protein TOPH_09088 [Tolypocladium ophioglossoides CBS 100239]